MARAVLLLTSKLGPGTSLERALVADLPAHGVTPVLAAAEPDGLVAALGAQGRAVRLGGLRDPRTLRGLVALPATLARLAGLARRHRVDVVHSLRGSTTIAARWLARLTGIPAVCHMQFLYAAPVKFRKLGLHRAEHVVAVARAVLEAYRAACPEHRPRLARVIPYGIDASGFAARGAAVDVRAALGIPRDAFLVGMVGSLDARKDPETLLAAVARLGPAARVLFVGPFRSAAYRDRLLATVRRLDLAARCHFAGPQPDPSPFFRALDVLALPTRGDALPLVLLEAMAHGKPVVASRVGGIPEVVEDGVTGLLAPPGDAAAFAAALAELAAPERRRALGAAARERVERAFARERMLREVVEVYRAVAGR